MNSQSNGACLPVPLARKAERVLMIVAASYNVIMASVTLFMFGSWFKGRAYDVLERNGMLQTDYSAVDNASTVTNIYALLVLSSASSVSFTAMRCLAPGTVNSVGDHLAGDCHGLLPRNHGSDRTRIVFRHSGDLSCPQQGRCRAAGCDS